MDNDEKRNDWVPIIILFVAITAFITPFIIYCIAQCNGTNSGIIGDTIGGSTAPLIGLLSSVLLYFSFSSQVSANRISREEANFKYFLDEFERTKELIDDFTYIQKTNSNTYSKIDKYDGLNAIKTLTGDLFVKYNSDIPSSVTNLEETCKKLLFYFKSFYIFVKEVSDLNKSQYEKYRRIIESKIKLYFDETLSPDLDIISNLSVDNETNLNLKQHLIELKKISDNIRKKIGEFEKEKEETEI